MLGVLVLIDLATMTPAALASLPLSSPLVRATLPQGSARPWVSRSPEGLLVLPPIQ